MNNYYVVAVCQQDFPHQHIGYLTRHPGGVEATPSRSGYYLATLVEDTDHYFERAHALAVIDTPQRVLPPNTLAEVCVMGRFRAAAPDTR